MQRRQLVITDLYTGCSYIIYHQIDTQSCLVFLPRGSNIFCILKNGPEWYQQDSQLRHPSLICPAQQQEFDIPPWTKHLCGSCGIQHRTWGTQEESRAPMYWVISTQNLAPAVDAVWPMNWLQLLSATVWEPLENTELDNHHRWDRLCGSPGVQQRSSNTLLEKTYLSSDTLEEVRGNVSLYLHQPLPQGSTVQCQENTFRHMISPTGENESMWVSTWPPQLCRTFLKSPISLSLHPEYWIESQAAQPGGGKWWVEQKPGFWTYQRDADPTNHLVDSMSRPDHESLSYLSHGSSPTVPWATPVLSTPHSYIPLPHLMASSLCTLPTAERVHSGRQLVSRHRKLAQICRPGKDHKLEF